jgi:hypothetical protein
MEEPATATLEKMLKRYSQMIALLADGLDSIVRFAD